jgi:hypothetical protein
MNRNRNQFNYEQDQNMKTCGDGDDNIYYNVILEPDQKNSNTPCIFERYESKAVVNNPCLYDLQIAKFSIGTFNLPIFIAQATGNPMNKNELIYTFTITYQNVDYTQNIQYNPFGLRGSLESYYYVYLYSDFLIMMNSCLQSIMSDINALVGPIPGNPEAPFIFLNQDTQLISMKYQYQYWNSINGILQLSSNLYTYEPFINNVSVTYPFTISNPFDPKSVVYTVKNINDQYDPSTGYIYMTQEFVCLNLWSDVNALLFTSNLPVQNEFLNPTSYNNTILANTVSLPILQHFIINYPEFSSSPRNSLNYYVNVFLPIKMVNNTPLTQINVSVYWLSRTGQIYQHTLAPFESMTIKLLFRKL